MRETSRPWELLLPLDRDASTTLRAQLQQRLRDAIASGALAGGDRLPSRRGRAGHLDVSRGVATDASERSGVEGLVELRERAAPPVAPAAAAVDGGPGPAAAPPAPRFDFSATSPDLARFP